MTNAFEQLLKSISSHQVIDPEISYQDYCVLDLSVNNQDLAHLDISSSNTLESYVYSVIKSNNSKVAYGGYLEQRAIYKRSEHFNDNPETERNIHLGLDIWAKTGTSVHAPLDGVLHSFKNNTNYGDYGPTIILEHNIEGFKFHTLYGHLSLESLTNLKKGQVFKQGEQVATLGSAKVNGDYPPHLHFQIIRDLQDNFGDYPGVSNKQDLRLFKENCTNPNWLLKID